MTYFKFFIAIVLSLCLTAPAYGFKKVTPKKRTLEYRQPGPVQVGTIFNDARITPGGYITSTALYVGDWSFDDGLARDRATMSLTLALANTCTNAVDVNQCGQVTVTYDSSHDGQSWYTDRASQRPKGSSKQDGLLGFFASSDTDGFDPDDGDGSMHYIDEATWSPSNVANGAGPYMATNTTYVTAEVSPTNYIRFRAVNSHATRPITIDLIGQVK